MDCGNTLAGCRIQGVSPRSNGANYTVWQLNNGYTAVDLTTLQYFSSLYNSGAYQGALQLNIRNTLPATTFAQSGLAVPFSTTQYLRSGSGIMGAYVPAVSYVSLPPPAQVILPSFPAVGQPTGTPTRNTMVSPGNPQNFPEQYWPSSSITGAEKLACATSKRSPVIYFVGTQFATPVEDATYFPGAPTGCNQAASLNACSQLFAQVPQLTANASQSWPPGLPLTIEGVGFGTLPEPSLPFATTGWGATAYLTITDLNFHNQVNWTSPSNGPNVFCQMYILKWSDRSITVLPNLETTAVNGMNTALSLLTETNPLTLPASSSCQVTATDSITITVTNPQTGGQPTLLSQPVKTYAGSLN